MLTVKRAVITGATGVLGMALIDKLISEKVDVYVVCNPTSRRNEQIRNHVQVHKVYCDLRDLCKLPTLISCTCDVFYHFAWLGTGDPKNRMNMHMQTLNIQYSLDAVQVAADLGCQVFIGAGSQAEYGYMDGIIQPDSPVKPVSGYGMAKLCAGQMTRALCQVYKIRHIWARVLSVYGMHDGGHTLISTVIHKLLIGEKPALTAGEQVWDYLYAGDAANAFYRMAQAGRDGATYVLGSGKTKMLKEFICLIRDAINPDLPLGIGEIPYYPDQAMHLNADISTLVADTGWVPVTEFADGIQYLIEEEKECLHKQ